MLLEQQQLPQGQVLRRYLENRMQYRKKESNKWIIKFGGGGGGGDPPPPPIPPGPTEWLYDRSGNPAQLVTVGSYVRVGDPQDGNFKLNMQDISNPVAGYTGGTPKGKIITEGNGKKMFVATGGFNQGTPQANNSTTLYRSVEAAQAANPQMWLYDPKGHTTRQIFNSDYQIALTAGNQNSLLNGNENFGPDNTPYQHIYDKYGVDQGYQPVATGVPDQMYDSSTKSPFSPDYVAPTSLTETDPALQAGVTQASADIAASKNQTLVRQKGKQAAAAALTDNPVAPNSTTGGTGGNNTLVGG